MGLVSFAIRGGICIYAVKYTVDKGAWGHAEEAIAFKNAMCKSINENHYYSTGKAHFQAHVPTPEVRFEAFYRFVIVDIDNRLSYHFQLPHLPSKNEIGYLTTHYYNNAVKSTFHFIEMLPCYTGQMIKKAKDSIGSALDQPPAK